MLMPKRFIGIRVVIIFCIFSLFTVETTSAANKKPIDERDKVLGVWKGESICVGNNNPYCKDEIVVYTFTKTQGSSTKVTLTADKIVNGEIVPMYVMDFDFDGKTKLTNEFKKNSTHGIWEYTIKGEIMEGTLVLLPEKSVARRIKVKKEK